MRVKLFASLMEYAPVEGLPGTPFLVEIPADATIGDLIDQLKLPRDMVKIAFVNGIIQNPDWKIQPADDIGIFPPIGGGSN